MAGNEAADSAANKGARKEEAGPPELTVVPKMFNLTRAQLLTLTHSLAYAGIRAQAKREPSQSTEDTLETAR